MSTVENNLKKYFEEDVEELVYAAQELHCYNGSYEFCDTYDLEEVCDIYRDRPYDLVCAIIFGDVQNVNDPVRFNCYANLETVTEYDVQDECLAEIDDIVKDVIEHAYDCCFNSDIMEIIANEEDEEEEEA